MAWSDSATLIDLEPGQGWFDESDPPQREPALGWTGIKSVAVPTMGATAELTPPTGTSSAVVHVPGAGLAPTIPFTIPGVLQSRPQMNGHAGLPVPDVRAVVVAPVIGAAGDLHTPLIISAPDHTYVPPVMDATGNVAVPFVGGGVEVNATTFGAYVAKDEIPYTIPWEIGLPGFRVPTISSTNVATPTPMTAAGDLHTPLITSGVTVPVPPMAVDCDGLTATPSVSTEVDTVPPMTAAGQLHTPTVTSGTQVNPPAMTATVSWYPNTVASGANLAAGVILESDSVLHTPVVASGATVGAPAMGATAELSDPLLDVSAAPAVEPSDMVADAEMLVPTILGGHGVAAPTMTAPAAVPVPSVQKGSLITVTDSMELVVTGIPYEVPFIIGQHTGMRVPDVRMWTDTALPDPLAATVAIPVPVVTSGALVTVPIMSATAAWSVPTVTSGARPVSPLMSATGNLGDATKGPLPMSPVTQQFTTAGTFTYNIPSDALFIDIVLLGGGASGQTGNGANTVRGGGGNAGGWTLLTLQRGADIPWSATQISVTVGAGGAQPANSDHAGPNNGASTSITVTGYGTSTAAGGTGKTGAQNGGSPGSRTLNGTTYTGGSGGTGNGGAGTAPGAGGAGGNGGIFGSRTRGGAGSVGRVWFRAYQ